MASAFLSQINDEFLKCPICCEDAINPKVLPCLHSFCLNCLKKLVNAESKNLVCPKCRQEVELPESGVTGLQDNFFISDLAESVSNWKSVEDKENQPVCSGCISRDAATARCLTCLDFMCENCVALHKQLRVFRNHCVVTLEELRSGEHADSLRVKLEPLRCEQHDGEVLRFYCPQCKVPICRDCTVLDHPKPDHAFIRLKDAVENQRGDLKTLLESTTSKLNGFKGAVVNAENAMEKLGENRKKAEEDVKKVAEDLKAKIDNDKDALLRQIEDQTNAKDKQLQANMDSLQLDLCKLTSACELTENILEVGTEWEIISLHQQLANRMQELENTALQQQENELQILRHIALATCTVDDSTNLIGKINTQNPPAEE
ncbi:E3 ubiquitin-protein ligase TRIM56-like [Ptychodera flava]|uniref:E3 ubiquitin-protein ligase TRIM56-like n=1 Tax=Ptychodera flava TaxID=63121 RepID=UPI00396A29C3